jgi:UDP-N-acetyl-D-mannosaminuronate dehydrogenase
MKKLYSSVIKKAHLASNIATAEMAKVIENVQRDINIAFVKWYRKYYK